MLIKNKLENKEPVDALKLFMPKCHFVGGNHWILKAVN